MLCALVAAGLSLGSSEAQTNATTGWSSSNDPGIPGVIEHGPRDQPRIALTFDADMTPYMKTRLQNGAVRSYNNTRIYDILQKTQTKATFFLSGMWIELYPEQTRALAQNPLFELANHSYSHPGFAGSCYGLPPIQRGQAQAEMEKTQRLLEKVGGVKNRFFRFPGGCYAPSDLEVARSVGLTVVHWDAAGGDGDQPNPRVIEQNVLRQVRNGSIILLHSHGGPKVPATQDALPAIISTLKKRGFTFVKLSELLP